jgi:hypothetical protein
MMRSGFKISDQFQGQGVPRIENGAYTLVREYFNSGGTTQPLGLSPPEADDSTSRGCFKSCG